MLVLAGGFSSILTTARQHRVTVVVWLLTYELVRLCGDVAIHNVTLSGRNVSCVNYSLLTANKLVTSQQHLNHTHIRSEVAPAYMRISRAFDTDDMCTNNYYALMASL